MSMPLDQRPKLIPLDKRGWWRLTEDWTYKQWVVKAGFECDLDSVPAVPWIFAFFKGRTKISALLHDWLYGLKSEGLKLSRKEVDDLFLEMMLKEEGVAKRWAYPIWAAVRLAGWWYWYDFPERIRRAVGLD